MVEVSCPGYLLLGFESGGIDSPLFAAKYADSCSFGSDALEHWQIWERVSVTKVYGTVDSTVRGAN